MMLLDVDSWPMGSRDFPVPAEDASVVPRLVTHVRSVSAVCAAHSLDFLAPAEDAPVAPGLVSGFGSAPRINRKRRPTLRRDSRRPPAPRHLPRTR